MNMQQVNSRPSSNGYSRRRESMSRLEHKQQSGKTNLSRLTNEGAVSGNKSGGYESASRDRLVYLTTCLIGHNVEIQVKDGSLFSGIFHATNAEKDFGIILKMARSIRSASSPGQKYSVDSSSKAPSKTLIIPAKELVQITAKGVSMTRDGFTDDLQHVKRQDIMLDSSISQSRHVEGERELEPWVPDEDDPQCPELDHVFDGPWDRAWNQFEANETLFGVKSTFDEELYTTKLEKGPRMRELEREASKIAREIEGEDTQDLHLAEERGIALHEKFDIDEETKFSSVFRHVDDGGYDEDEDILLDSQNSATFGGASSLVNSSLANLTGGKSNDGAQVSPHSSSMDEMQSSVSNAKGDQTFSGSSDHSRELSSEMLSKQPALDVESSLRNQASQFSELHAGNNDPEELEKPKLAEEAQTSESEDLQVSPKAKKDGPVVVGLSPASISHGSSKVQGKLNSPGELIEDAAPVKPQVAVQSAISRGRPGSSTSSTSECGGAAPSASSGPGVSRSSSVGSLSSEKSTLNPHAKEFKLNPNAKSFIPSQTPVRPASPVSDGPFYFPPNVGTVPPMHGMPVGIGVGPMQSAQPYFHPNGPQYGQQMFFGHPRPVVYMPTYPPEMPFKGRDF